MIRLDRVVGTGLIKYCLTWCGFGFDMTVAGPGFSNENLWEYYNIPFLKLHGDTPANFLDRHLDCPKTSVNMYGFEEHYEFNKVVAPDGKIISTVQKPYILYDFAEEGLDDSIRLKGKLFFPKNGPDVGELEAHWRNELAPELGRQLRELSMEVLAVGLEVGPLKLHELVLSYLAAQKIDLKGNRKLLSFYVAHMDQWLRRMKTAIVGEALLSFPVLIMGSGWGFLDSAKAVATIGPALDHAGTEELYRTQLGVIDHGPNTDTMGHDRMTRAAGAHAFALTNRTTWLEGLCPDLNEVGFTFSREAIQESVHVALKDPERCLALGRSYGRAFRAAYPPAQLVQQLASLAEMVRKTDSVPGCGSVPFW